MRCGGHEPVAIDVRVIAATAQDLEALVQAGTFREELYYQLNVVPLRVPPLRERIEDIPELLRYYADFFANRDKLPYRNFPVAVQNRLRNYPWPGNLRELRNLVQRLLILGKAPDVGLEEIELALGAPERPREPRGGYASISRSRCVRRASNSNASTCCISSPRPAAASEAGQSGRHGAHAPVSQAQGSWRRSARQQSRHG